ncbi:MAG TPA: hypothetical protein VFX31_13425 [Ktedonobacterales bacterium]|nr:hypothetical protein [Ktedonobacterales bacterium]HEX5572388.1 hypothetical protein [Ktedonobacterales bacterium]
MGNDHSNDDWDQFDSAHWNVASDSDESGAADRPSSGDEDAHYSDGFLRPALADVDDEAPTTRQAGDGRWVTQGGVLRWQANDAHESSDDEGTETPLREAAESSWAADDLQLPLGAPAATRLRAVRAWLARRRLRETELIGALLLERRRLAGHPADDDESAAISEPSDPNDPLALALTEAQAAADEYETLLALLAETRAHVGPQSALVEYYLAITERLAALAAQPAAPADFASAALFAEIERPPASGGPTPPQRSEWEGRAGATLATRRRVEQVTATEPDDD